MAVTPAQFKTAKPQFTAVPDQQVQGYLDLAARQAEGFLPSDVDQGTIAYACHLMTLDGLGTDAESKGWRKGTAEFQTVKSGTLTLTRFKDAAGGSDYGEWLKSTSCGKIFFWMLRGNRGGPRLIIGGVGGAVSAYAKDWPLG